MDFYIIFKSLGPGFYLSVRKDREIPFSSQIVLGGLSVGELHHREPSTTPRIYISTRPTRSIWGSSGPAETRTSDLTLGAKATYKTLPDESKRHTPT